MIRLDRTGARGARIPLKSGKALVDYDMDRGRVIVGHGEPEIEAARAGRDHGGGEPFEHDVRLLASSLEDAAAIVDAVRREKGAQIVVSDESVLFGRVDPAPGWDLRLVGPAAAAGMDFAAVIARDGVLLEGIQGPRPPAPAAVAVAEVVLRLCGPLVVHQLSGRAGRLARGIAEVAAGVGLDVEADQPGGWFELRFTAAAAEAGVPVRFRDEMLARGYLVPAAGPWWPCLAHDYYTIEQTVDCAAAAMAAAAR